MNFVPQNKLEEKLIQASSDPAHRPEFYRDFVESDIYLIQQGASESGSGSVVFEEGYQFQVRTLTFNNKSYIPVYSSLYRLQAALTENSNYLSLNGLDFLKIVRGSGIILNPGTRYAKPFSQDEIEAIINGTIWGPENGLVLQRDSEAKIEQSDAEVKIGQSDSEVKIGQSDSQVMVGQPARYPTELVKALKHLFKNIKAVERAYVAHYFDPETDKDPRPVIGLEVTDNWNEIITEADRVARESDLPAPP